jgi:hypothetical protein
VASETNEAPGFESSVVSQILRLAMGRSNKEHGHKEYAHLDPALTPLPLRTTLWSLVPAHLRLNLPPPAPCIYLFMPVNAKSRCQARQYCRRPRSTCLLYSCRTYLPQPASMFMNCPNGARGGGLPHRGACSVTCASASIFNLAKGANLTHIPAPCWAEIGVCMCVWCFVERRIG